MTAKYVTVKIPLDIAREIDPLIGKHGFKSRAEIVKESLRALLKTYAC